MSRLHTGPMGRKQTAGCILEEGLKIALLPAPASLPAVSGQVTGEVIWPPADTCPETGLENRSFLSASPAPSSRSRLGKNKGKEEEAGSQRMRLAGGAGRERICPWGWDPQPCKVGAPLSRGVRKEIETEGEVRESAPSPSLVRHPHPGYLARVCP